MNKKFVIVESPTKARTISAILGGNVVVKATMGHIRDLPEREFGIDFAHDFTPTYRIIPRKRKLVAELKKAAEGVAEIYLATDEDREGEAIAWHTLYALDRKPEEIKRVAFHEITPEAVRAAFAAPRAIALDLVNAQQARRILDRIVGYTLSPFLDQHLGPFLQKGLSAGRVQSVALRIIVEREREIEKFVPQDYFVIRAKVAKDGASFTLDLAEMAGKKVEQLTFLTPEAAATVLAALRTGTLTVARVTETEKALRPAAPFVTSTLQQEASVRLGFPAVKTMAVAQQLYEGISLGTESTGLITYMRTDSPSVARQAQDQAFRFITHTCGPQYVPDRPPVYRAKLATAQEAHECIRPTSVLRTPDSLAAQLTSEQAALYRLIWDRFVASQMKPARIKNLRITARNGDYAFEGESNQVLFDGFTRVWPSSIQAGIAALAALREGDELPVEEYVSEQRTTKAPPRYTEATLIRLLEKYTIGRPSTYAPTIATLLERGYVRVESRALIPMRKGLIVNDILVRFFPEIIRIDFTAQMEEDLDRIADGARNWTDSLRDFYAVFKPVLDDASHKIRRDQSFISSLFTNDRNCPKCGAPLTIRRGKYGPFLGCTKYPECDYTEKGTGGEPGTETQKACPKCGGALVKRKSKFGVFLGCSNYPKCTYTERTGRHARYSRNRFKKRSGGPAVQGKV